MDISPTDVWLSLMGLFVVAWWFAVAGGIYMRLIFFAGGIWLLVFFYDEICKLVVKKISDLTSCLFVGIAGAIIHRGNELYVLTPLVTSKWQELTGEPNQHILFKFDRQYFYFSDENENKVAKFKMHGDNTFCGENTDEMKIDEVNPGPDESWSWMKKEDIPRYLKVLVKKRVLIYLPSLWMGVHRPVPNDRSLVATETEAKSIEEKTELDVESNVISADVCSQMLKIRKTIKVKVENKSILNGIWIALDPNTRVRLLSCVEEKEIEAAETCDEEKEIEAVEKKENKSEYSYKVILCHRKGKETWKRAIFYVSREGEIMNFESAGAKKLLPLGEALKLVEAYSTSVIFSDSTATHLLE